MARILLNSEDEISVGGTNDIIFNSAGTEVLSLDPGSKATIFGFQRGGETIVLDGPATDYTFTVNAANVTITALDGTVIKLTVGSTAGSIVFGGGSDSRDLVIAGGAVQLDGATLPNGVPTVPVAGPGTYTVAAQDGFVQHEEGVMVTYVITRTSTVGAESLTFSVAGDNNGGTVPPAIAGIDFTVGSATVTFADGQSTATFNVFLTSDLAVEGVEGYKITVFDGAQVVATTTQLLADATNKNGVGQTFQLTTGIDTVAGLIGSGGSTSTVGNDTIVGTQSTLTTFDNIDGGAGDDTLQVLDTGTGAPASFGFTTIKNVENLQYVSTRGFEANKLNTTAMVGLKTLDVTVDTGFNQTITSTIDMTKMTITNSDDGNISVVGGGGSLTVNVLEDADVNVGQTAVDNNFTDVTVNGGSVVSVRDVNNGSSLTTITLNDFDNDVYLEGDGLSTINIDDIANDGTWYNEVNIADAAATLTVNLSNIDDLGNFGIYSNGANSLIVNGNSGLVEIDEIQTDGTSVTLNAVGSNVTLDGDITGNSLTSVALNATGGAIDIDDINGVNTLAGNLSVTISGGSSVSIDSVSQTANGQTTIVSTNTAGVYIDNQLGDNTSFTGGTGADNVAFGDNDLANDMGGGDDTVRLNAGDIDGTISGGAGKDTLVMTSINAAAITATTSGLSNFEVLALTPAQGIPQTDTINLANAGFTAGVATYVVSDGSAPGNVQETATISFSGIASGAAGVDGADTLTFTYGADSTSVIFENKDDAVAMATEFAAALNADGNAEWDAVDNGDGTVTLVHTAGGFTTDVTAANFSFADKTTPGAPALEAPVNALNFGTTNEGEDAVVGVAEVWTLNLTSVTLNPGETLTLTENRPFPFSDPAFTYTNGAAFPIDQDGGALALAIVAAANGDGDFSARWTATRVGNDVVFTANSTGDRVDLTLSGSLTVADNYTFTNTTPGVTANAAEQEQAYFTLDGAAIGDDQVLFDGQTITFAGTETTAAQLRATFVAQYNALPVYDPILAPGGRTWTASNGLGSTIVLTSVVAEARTNLQPSDFVFVDDVSNGTGAVSVVTDVQGSTGSIVLNNFTSGGTLELNGGGLHVVNLNANSGADVFNLVLSGTGNLGTVDITSDGSSFETVNIDTAGIGLGVDSIVLLDANEVDNIKVVGADDLVLTANGTGIVSFDASDLSGDLNWTTGALTGAATIETGSGDNYVNYSAATKAVTFIGGSGDDTVVINVAPGSLDLTAGGNDIINLAVPTSGGNYTTIDGFSDDSIVSAGGDGLVFAGAGAFDTAAVTLVNPLADLQDYLDAANAGNNDGSLQWFVFAGNTYVVQDNSNQNTFQGGLDTVIELQGVLDLTTFSVQGGMLANFA